MARKTKQVRIADGTPETNRDYGKVYIITEMAAYAAERWAADAFQGLVSAGVDVPDDLASTGIVAIAQMGLKALGGMPRETFRDLMDRMLPCITYVPDPARPEVTRILTGLPPFENDAEEVSTLFTLRREVLMLHADFLQAAGRSLAGRGAPALT